MKWTRAGATGDFAEGRGRTVRIQGRRVAIFRYADQLYALDAICPHAGSDLGPGRVRNRRVSCPDHGWTFDLATGCMPGADEIAVRTFPVKVEGDQIYVDLGGGDRAAPGGSEPG